MFVKVLKLVFIFLVFTFFGYLYFTFDPINNLLFPKCPLYASTGIYCPGCGSQRATHSLLHFDIVNVFRNNLLFFPFILLITYHLGIRAINIVMATSYKSILDHTKAPWIVLIIVLSYWVLRNIPYFSYLAP